MHALPEEFERMAHAVLDKVGSGLLDDVHDQVQQGVKRFAKALPRVKPGLKHADAIELVSIALGFRDWHDLNASLSKIHENTERLLTRLSIVADCPIAPYDRPCTHELERLKAFAARLAEMLGRDLQTVLDQVVAYVHEAGSFAELMARDPCIAAPAYEVVEAGPGDGGSYIRMTPMGQAALYALVHEMKRLHHDPRALVERLLGIVETSPLFFGAWTELLGHFELHEPGSIHAQVLCESFADIVSGFLVDAPSLDPDADGNQFIGHATRSAMINLIACGDVDSAYALGLDVRLCMDESDPQNLRYFMAALLCHQDLEGELHEEIDGAEFIEDFTEGLRRDDVDSLLCVGMMALRHDDMREDWAFSLLARANLATHGALRKGLAGKRSWFEDMPEDLVDSEDFTISLIESFRGCNRELCDAVARVLNTPAMRTAERVVRDLYFQLQDEDEDSFCGVDLQLVLRSETVSRSAAMSEKMGVAWLALRGQTLN